jgi:hypothetical protein
MRYRAGINFGAARALLEENSLLWQYALREYHGFSVQFTLPLTVACTSSISLLAVNLSNVRFDNGDKK